MQRLVFDPANVKTTGQPEAITQGTRFITSPDVSPDGEWLVYSSQGERQEDIFLIKKDGTNPRQLTNDHFIDRFPRWSPNGNHIAFYSDRSGRYEIWRIDADGSGLQQLTLTAGSPTLYPLWSPDGSQIVFKQRGHLPFVIEANKSWQAQTTRQLLPDEKTREKFWPWSWSPDGRKLAGWWRDGAGSNENIQIYTFETKSYEQLTSFGGRPVWLHDNRHLLFLSGGRIYILDSVTKKTQQILSPLPNEVETFCLTRDDSILYYTLLRTEADIWLLNLEEQRK